MNEARDGFDLRPSPRWSARFLGLGASPHFPIALGLRSFRSSFQEEHMWPYLMAASTVATAPIIILFFFVQRTFIEGISVTGLKG